MKTKREIAADLVADYARYVSDSAFKKYQIRLRGKLFIDSCTASLADQVTDAFSYNKLSEMNKTNMRNT